MDEIGSGGTIINGICWTLNATPIPCRLVNYRSILRRSNMNFTHCWALTDLPLTKHVAWDVIKRNDADPNFWHILVGCYTTGLKTRVRSHAFWQDIQWHVSSLSHWCHRMFIKEVWTMTVDFGENISMRIGSPSAILCLPFKFSD